MKKNIIFLSLFLFVFTSVILSAQSDEAKEFKRKKAGNMYRSLFEAAHPSPGAAQKKLPNFLLSAKQELPYFLNINTIEPETELYRMQNESSIAVNPKNPLNLVASAVDYRDSSSTWVYVSHDAGKTWKNINLKRPFPGWTSSNDPSVAFDPEGIAYLVYGGFGDRRDSDGVMYGENAVFIAKSSDEGLTWKAHTPVIIHQGLQTLDSPFEDKYYISVDNSPSSPYYKDLYIPWKRVTPKDSATQIVLSKSTDKGDTWSNPVNVSKRLPGSSEDTTFGQSFPLVVTGPDGEVYCVWNHGIEHGVGFAKSTDGGITFSEPRIVQRYNIFGETRNLSAPADPPSYRHSVKGKVRAESYPIITCDTTNGPGRGNLYLVWAGDRVPNIYFSRSTDGGDTWSTPVIPQSDTTNDQFWAWIALDPMNGDLAIMYLDSRLDPANIGVDCFISYSSDGGLSWIDRRTSDIQGDLRKNPFGQNSFAGDYSGCAFYHGKIYPSWIDMRSAETNIFDSDVYTAMINTQLPEPVKKFEVKILPEKPTELDLSWTAPTARVFGQTLNSSNYHYALYRNGVYQRDLANNVSNYSDTQLTKYEKYIYSICVVAGADTSVFRLDTAFAGGSKNPAMPELSHKDSLISNILQNTLFVKIPSLREDGITPLVNLKEVALYQDGQFVKNYSVNQTDTGKTVQIEPELSETGYYRFYVKILDSQNPQNSSQASKEDTLWYGSVDGPDNDLTSDDYNSRRCFNIGGWGIVDNYYGFSGSFITESPTDKYKNSTNYILNLPVFQLYFLTSMSKSKIINGGNGIEFHHSALIYPNDTAFVEFSFNMKDWKLWKKFNRSSYSKWQDSTRNLSDFMLESLPVYLSGNVTQPIIVYPRLRLSSNGFRNDEGWYIYGLNYNVSTGVNDGTIDKSRILLFPNPAENQLFVNYSGSINFNTANLKVYSVLGVELACTASQSGEQGVSLDISHLQAGIYFILLQTSTGIINEKFVVRR